MPEKLLIVGDGAIGKTCLLSRFTNDHVVWDDNQEPDYEPTTFNNFILEWTHSSGESCEVEMWDTAGQEAFSQLRLLSYPDTDVFLIGFSCVSVTTLTNIKHKWMVELNDASVGGAWLILVGTKCDLRENNNNAVEDSAAIEIAKEIGASAYIPTSAKTQEGIEDLKNVMVDMALKKAKGHEKPKFGEYQQGAPEAQKGQVKEGRAPTQKELAVGQQADKVVRASSESKAKKEPAKKPKEEPPKKTEPPKNTQKPTNTNTTAPKTPSGGAPKTPSGGSATGRRQDSDKKKGEDGPGCSCTIA